MRRLLDHGSSAIHLGLQKVEFWCDGTEICLTKAPALVLLFIEIFVGCSMLCKDCKALAPRLDDERGC